MTPIIVLQRHHHENSKGQSRRERIALEQRFYDRNCSMRIQPPMFLRILKRTLRMFLRSKSKGVLNDPPVFKSNGAKS